MREELRRNWGGWLVFFFMFVVIPVLALWLTTTQPNPEVSRQWTLDDGTVCYTFRGYQSVTCVSGHSDT